MVTLFENNQTLTTLHCVINSVYGILHQADDIRGWYQQFVFTCNPQKSKSKPLTSPLFPIHRIQSVACPKPNLMFQLSARDFCTTKLMHMFNFESRRLEGVEMTFHRRWFSVYIVLSIAVGCSDKYCNTRS